jgi:hypothetical protein
LATTTATLFHYGASVCWDRWFGLTHLLVLGGGIEATRDLFGFSMVIVFSLAVS